MITEWPYVFWGVKKRYRWLGLWLLSVAVRFAILNAIFPCQVKLKYSQIVTDNNGMVIHAFLTTDDKWRMYTELEEITPEIEQAFIAKEDKYFYHHFGVNPMAVMRAVFNNIIYGKRTSGASTITMQVVRLLNPKDRTYFNKLIEIFRAIQLEMNFSKDEILQMYLNLVPYGGNIEGIKAASVLYFDKMPNHLSIAEVTALTIIPNRPTSLQLGVNNAGIMEERDKWLNRFRDEGVFTAEQIQDALDEDITAYRHDAPKLAPHFSWRVKQAYPNTPIIKTYLNLEMQRKLEQLVRDYMMQLYSVNIRNAAVMVINNHTNAVEAYLGSADFYNTEDAGQVDGITAVRSPGSTLKPLLYGLAFDQGIITPKSMISDVPVNYSGYQPENYDGEFRGQVSIEFALANSLNVPAVKTLDAVELNNFLGAMEKANFKQIKQDAEHGKLGLSSVLGGCGATLEELVHLYHMLGNEGNYVGFNWLQGEETTYEKRILSEESAFMVSEVLTQLTRPDLPLEWHNSANLPKVAWKTGTSYGRRDAWSIGYNKDYTIGVWVGNFSADGVPELSGAVTAAPLLFNIFNTINYNSPKEWYGVPSDIDFRLVCSESGDLPNEFCENTIMDYYIPGVSPANKCQHMKQVWINLDSTVSYCGDCLPESGYVNALYSNYPPEIFSYFDAYNINYDHSPPHNPECERLFTTGKPQIMSPVAGVEYYIDKVDSMQMMLSCNVNSDVEYVYWYINNKYYKKAKATDKVFFSPPEGSVKISCTDDKGRNTDLTIIVKEVTF